MSVSKFERDKFYVCTGVGSLYLGIRVKVLDTRRFLGYFMEVEIVAVPQGSSWTCKTASINMIESDWDETHDPLLGITDLVSGYCIAPLFGYDIPEQEGAHNAYPGGSIPPPDTKIVCTCEIGSLMRNGCTCGAFQREMKRKLQYVTD